MAARLYFVIRVYAGACSASRLSSSASASAAASYLHETCSLIMRFLRPDVWMFGSILVMRFLSWTRGSPRVVTQESEVTQCVEMKRARRCTVSLELLVLSVRRSYFCCYLGGA